MRRLFVLLLLAWSLAPAPARADWLRAESPNFIVYGEMREDRLRERVHLLEEFDAFLRVLTGTTAPPSPNKLKIYLVRGGGELTQILPVGANVAGFYRASPDAVLAVADESDNWGSNENDTLLHEYAHHFMMQYHPAPYPAWYVEGFAEYVMTAVIRPERIEYGNYNRMRASWLTAWGSWTPYEEILFGDLRRVGASQFYAQSWLMVHYIMSDEARRAAFVRFIQAIARGEEPRPAFTAAFGMEGDEIDRRLRAYSRRITFHRITRAAGEAPPPIAIEEVGSGRLNPPLIEAALTLSVPQRERRRLLERARRAGERDDPFGRRLQARAEILYGDLTAADIVLDALLAAAPSDAELLYLKGLRHLVAGHRDAAVRTEQYRLAQGYFARAFRADPNHYPSLFRYAEALSLSDQFLTENTQNVLVLATSLAPQVAEIRLAAVHVLLLRDKFEQAEALLLPMSASIHHPQGGQRTTEFLRLARARERPSDTIVFKIPSDPAEAANLS